jgi:hypothetical protein
MRQVKQIWLPAGGMDLKSTKSVKCQASTPCAFREISENPVFQEALPGHLPADGVSQARLPGLRNKIRAIASLD